MSHIAAAVLFPYISAIHCLAASDCGFFGIRQTYKQGFYQLPSKMSLLEWIVAKKRYDGSEDCDEETETATTK